MSFGFGAGGFGSTTSPSPFGQTSPAFGAVPSPFGAQPASPSPFGTTPATFGQAQAAPVFAATSTPAFGSTGFGAAPTAFGSQAAGAFGARPAATGGFGAFGAASSPSPFGAQSTPAFGATNQTAFGASTGASPFGTGLSSAPLFGASSSPSFGAVATPFGGASTGFGTGTPGGMFGAGIAGATCGTRAVQYRKTQENDSSSQGPQKVMYNSISVMPEYSQKSTEELRWEDYSSGCKGNMSGAAGSPSVFGASSGATFSSSPFGSAVQPLSPFGVTSQPAFGTSSTPAFGASTSTPTFGASSFGAQTAFGAASTSAFGAQAASPFGTSAPVFAGSSTPFGASSSPAFGANATPGFGAASTPAFGASAQVFGVASSPSFGAASTFGSAAPGASVFGSSPAPSTGQAFGASSPFGASSAFGVSSLSPFAPSSMPAFGSVATPTFGGTSTTPSLFGASAAPLFGSTPQGGGGAFGAASAPSLFGASGSTFGGTTTQSNAFGAFSAGSTSSLFGGASTFNRVTPSNSLMPTAGGMFSFAQANTTPFGATAATATPAVAPLGIGQTPYGLLPQPPIVGGNILKHTIKVGISQHPAGVSATLGSSTLITPRTIMPRSGTRMRPRWPFTVAHRAKDSLSLSPGYDMCCGVGSPAGSLFTPRENPRHLFIREAPPATSAVMPSSFVSSAGVPASKPISSSPCTPNLTIDMPETDKSADRQFSGESDGLGNILQIEDVHANGVSAADDEHVKDHLPVLRRDDYYMEPSMEVLAARAKGNPSTLKRVQGFTVGRHGFGHVKWLGVVDVTGLNLDSLVHIRSKVLEVYPCDADKPPEGEGLNKPARVTLLKVFKTDKSTGMPTTSEAAIKKFKKRLIEHSAEQHSKFVSYDPDSGEWVFDVEHFSRYGLGDDSDEDRESEDEDSCIDIVGLGLGTARQFQDVADASPVIEVALHYGTGDVSNSLEDVMADRITESRVEDAASDDWIAVDMSRTDHSQLGIQDGVMSNSLPHSLPANLRHDVQKLEGVHSTMVGKHSSLHPSGKMESSLFKAGAGNAGSDLRFQHSWTVRPCPLMPAMLAISTDSGAQDQNPNLSFVGSSHAHRQITGNQQGVLIGGKAAEQTWACVDIGLMLGRSSRPGWGPGGTLVRSVVSSTESSVLQTQIRFSNAVKHCHYIRGDQDAVQRCHARLVGSLQAHQKFSTRQSCTPGSLVPVRGLKCTRDRSSLSAVCNHFNQRALTAHESTSDESEKIVLAHEMGAWQLLVELFSDVDCSDVNRHATSTADMESLKNVRRKGLVSNLLRQLVRTTVQAAVVEAQTLEEVVLLWLTGHELGPALSAAASRGDVRLATLIAASGSGIAPIKHATSHQLDLWLAEGLDDHIAPMRLAIFKLLAGHIAETARAVQLDWRRSLGLYLWYGIPRTAPMQDVLHSYLDDVFRGDAEPPLPSYVAGTAEEQPHCGGSFFPDDVWFSMMILKAGMAHKATAQGRHNCDEISNILHPAGHTPDPLDHTFNWLLACVLQSIGAFEPFGISRGALATSVDTFFRLVSAVVAHAELLGEPMLAIYVACHIPDHPHKPGLRDRVVRQLLLRHVYFLQSHEDEHHLVSELGIPAAWIADALALKARYEKHNFEEIRQLIRAGSHDAAHNILIKDLAPTFFVYGMHQELQQLLQELAPVKHILEAWWVGGGIYTNYYEWLDEINGAVPPSQSSALASASRIWLAGCGSLATKVHLHIEKMAMVLSRIAQAVSPHLSKETCDVLGNQDESGLALPVPNQERLHQLQRLAGNVTKILASS